SPIRQKFALLISNENFHDFRICLFRQLSASIGRFSEYMEHAERAVAGKKDRHCSDTAYAAAVRCSRRAACQISRAASAFIAAIAKPHIGINRSVLVVSARMIPSP
ncbi:MAG: hypothetical protein ACREF3_21280, partial [Acetobacteraceae bacterium]